MMLLGWIRRMGGLFQGLSDEGNAPETPDADERDMIGAEGEPAELETPFGMLRRALPVVGTLTPRQRGVAMTEDEVVAWDMLRQHGFSRAALRASGELEAFCALKVRPDTEARWCAQYLEALLDDAEAQPDGLDVAMLTAAEYADEGVFQRALELVDDAVTAGRLRDGAVLGSCLCALRAIGTGRFDPAFAADAAGQALETANRAARRLEGQEAAREWLAKMPEIRALAAGLQNGGGD